jgi:hypothetical protein
MIDFIVGLAGLSIWILLVAWAATYRPRGRLRVSAQCRGAIHGLDRLAAPSNHAGVGWAFGSIALGWARNDDAGNGYPRSTWSEDASDLDIIEDDIEDVAAWTDMADGLADLPRVNPATGLPMTGGIGGVDSAGNPYGFGNHCFDGGLFGDGIAIDDSFAEYGGESGGAGFGGLDFSDGGTAIT